MAFFSHTYTYRRTKVCRACGQKFVTEFPAQKTCKRPECVEWSAALKKAQNAKSRARYLERMAKIKKGEV